VKLLLERGEVNPDKPEQRGRTPLSHAAGRGYEAVVKLLLEREEVNLDEPDKCSESLSRYGDTVGGRTPLSYAAGRGHEGVVKTL